MVVVVKIEKERAQKNRIIKRKLKFADYKNCLGVTQFENKINHLEKMKLRYTVKIKKIKKIIKNK